VFRGDDEALAALVRENGYPNKDTHSEGEYGTVERKVANIRSDVESGVGVGQRTIIAVNKARGVESRKKLVEMAIGMLKDSGEHDL